MLAPGQQFSKQFRVSSRTKAPFSFSKAEAAFQGMGVTVTYEITPVQQADRPRGRSPRGARADQPRAMPTSPIRADKPWSYLVTISASLPTPRAWSAATSSSRPTSRPKNDDLVEVHRRRSGGPRSRRAAAAAWRHPPDAFGPSVAALARRPSRPAPAESNHMPSRRGSVVGAVLWAIAILAIAGAIAAGDSYLRPVKTEIGTGVKTVPDQPGPTPVRPPVTPVTPPVDTVVPTRTPSIRRLATRTQQT